MSSHPTDQVSPALARQTWRLTEPLHAMIYFAEEPAQRYAELGLPGAPYFASRSAALGTPSAEVVLATFYNFSPRAVTAAIPAAWDVASPKAVLAARLAGADAMLRRVLGEAVTGPEIAAAAELAATAARAATEHPSGRPLFAAHAAIEWPEQPHLVLWHALTLLREFRGDGHIAALLVEGVTGIEALVGHAATGAAAGETLRKTRGWTRQQWQETVDALRDRGVLAPGEELRLTEAGQAQRQWIEDRTDVLALPGYGAIGADGCTRLGELARPFSRAVLDAGLFPLARSRP